MSQSDSEHGPWSATTFTAHRWPDLRSIPSEDAQRLVEQAGEVGMDRLAEVVGQAERNAPRSADATHPWAVEVPAVRITDRERGVTYEVTLEKQDGAAVLTSLALFPHQGVLNREALRRVPVQALADAALALQYGPGPSLRMGTTPAKRTGPPSAEEVARVYREATRDGVAARRRLHEVYNASLPAVDVWLRKARQAGLIPPARKGPKPKPRTASTKETKK